MTEIVDLTLRMHDGFTSVPLVWPKLRMIDFMSPGGLLASRFKDPCKGFDAKLLVILDHLGTHVDAPNHYIVGGKSIADVPVDSLMGSAVFFDVSGKPPDQGVTVEHLEAQSRAKGIEVRTGDIAIVRCWPGAWGAEGFHQCRGLSWAAAEWLMNRGVKAVGVDLVGVEEPNPAKPVHMGLLGRDILIIECLANLDKLTKTRFRFTALPLPIEGATGSPIRAIAEF